MDWEQGVADRGGVVDWESVPERRLSLESSAGNLLQLFVKVLKETDIPLPSTLSSSDIESKWDKAVRSVVRYC